MKLKYRLFLSYFFLIILFNISLFGLVLELRQLTTTLRGHVRQDIQSVILLSNQLQSLEQLNARIIRLNLPPRASAEKVKAVARAERDFEKTWKKIQSRLSNPYQKAWYDRQLDRIYSAVYPAQNDSIQFRKQQTLDSLLELAGQQWTLLQKNVHTLVEKPAPSPGLTWPDAVRALRNTLTALNSALGEKGLQNYMNMAVIARNTQRLMVVAEIVLLLVTLLIAFFVARKITRPLARLKIAVDRMAMQDFDVRIEKMPDHEVGNLARAFEQLAARLKEAESYKSAILSQFTHEMKSPLGSIKQATQLLESSLTGQTISGQQKRFLDIIKGNYERLYRLINNILHSSSYQMDKIRLKYSDVNMVKLVTEVLVLLSPAIKDKHIQVKLKFSSREIPVQADRERMSEVIQNIIENAVKFSDKGTTLTVSVVSKFPMVIIQVKDEGIGIPEKEIPYIFERLYRASNSGKISVKGTGLGLYICSQIVRAHGGQIDVRSRPEQGTRVKIQIPVNRSVAREKGGIS